MERIGLFTTKFIPHGENLTFHYEIYTTWWKLEFSLQNLHHLVKIAVFTTNLHYVVKIPVFTTNLHHMVKIFTMWWKFSLQIYTTWWKFSPHIYTTWWKFSLQNFHHMWWKWQFSLHWHYVVKIFTTKFTPLVVKIQIFTPHVVKNGHIFTT